MADTIIGHCHDIRALIREDSFHMSSITSRESLETTYIWMLRETGLDKHLKYRIIIWLMTRGRYFS